MLFSLLITTTSGPLLYCNELHKWVIVGLLTQMLIKCSYTRHGFMRAVALLFCKKLWITCLYQKNRVPAFWSFNLWRQFGKKNPSKKKEQFFFILFFFFFGKKPCDHQISWRDGSCISCLKYFNFRLLWSLNPILFLFSHKRCWCQIKEDFEVRL